MSRWMPERAWSGATRPLRHRPSRSPHPHHWAAALAVYQRNPKEMSFVDCSDAVGPNGSGYFSSLDVWVEIT